MQAAMIFFAILCIGLGVAPGPLYDILPFSTNYVPYTVPHVVNQLQLLLFAGLSFFLALPLMKRTLTISLDWDWFYRKFGVWLVGFLTRGIVEMRRDVFAGLKGLVDRIISLAFSSHGPDGLFARTSAVGASVAVIVVMLMILVVAFYTNV